MNGIKAVLYRETIEWRGMLIGFSVILAVILIGLVIAAFFLNNDQAMLHLGSSISLNGEELDNFALIDPKSYLQQFMQGDDYTRRLFMLVPLVSSMQSLFIIGLILLAAHLLRTGFSRDRKLGAEAFFRTQPVPAWQVVTVKLLFNVLAMMVAVLVTTLIYWIAHSFLSAVTFQGEAEISFLQVFADHWSPKLIGSIIVLLLAQIPWLLVLGAYLIAVSILLSRWEFMAGLFLPPLLGLLEMITLRSNHVFRLIGEYFSVPTKQLVQFGEAYATGSNVDWLAPLMSGEFLTLVLISLLLFAGSIYWYRWREVA